MLGDFQQHGSVLCRFYKQKILLNGEPFQQWLKRFEAYCQEREYSVVTCNHYRKATDRFLTLVESQGVWDVEGIVARHVPDYVKTLLGYSYTSLPVVCELHHPAGTLPVTVA